MLLIPEFEEGPARAAPLRFPFANHRTLQQVADGVPPRIDGADPERVINLLRWMKDE